MISKAVLLVALKALPTCHVDADDPRKAAQLETVASSISSAVESTSWAGDKRDQAAMLTSIGYHESRYCIATHEGKRKSYATGLWQVEAASHGVTRDDLRGLSQEQTDSSAMIAARVLSKSWRCGGGPRGWFVAYYGGCPCDAKGWEHRLAPRVRTFNYMRSVIGRELAKEKREAA